MIGMLLRDVDAHREQLTQITSLAVGDVTAYASTVAGESPERVAGQVREAAEAVVTTYGGVAAEGAALFYETQRPTPGFTARLAAPSVGEALAADLSWAFLPLFKPDTLPDPVAAFLSRLGGAVQRHVAAGDRQTLILSASSDPLAGGVRRFARAGSCGFCAYLSAIEADAWEQSEWHKNCHCVEVPWWEDNPLPKAPYMDEYADAASWARLELERRQREARKQHPDLRSRNFYRQFPELALTTRNLAALVRERLGLSH